MALQASDIADLVKTTQKELGKMKWTDLAGGLQEYVALPKLLKKEKVQFDDGYLIQWNVMIGTSGAARNVGLYQVDTVNVADQMQTASVPWRHATTNYAFDRREIAMNSGSSKIVDLVKVRRVDAQIELAKLVENDFWDCPSSSTDSTKPFGIDYYLVYNATTGFNGGNQTGFSAGPGGLDSTVYTRWKNFTAQYTNVTKPDLVAKMRQAATQTLFMSPVDVPDYNRGDRYGYYMAYATLAALESLLEAQNENLGQDVASQDGRLTFRRNPCTYVPQLDSGTAATALPVYGINWGEFYPVFLKGEYMVEEGPKVVGNQHTVFQTHVDLTYNWCCKNRRRQFLIAKSDPNA